VKVAFVIILVMPTILSSIVMHYGNIYTQVHLLAISLCRHINICGV